MGIEGSPPLEEATHSSLDAIMAPTIGVHKPTRSSIPAPDAIICGAIETKCELSLRSPAKCQRRTVAVNNRWSRRPVPGQPFGNVENRRCNKASLGHSRQTRNGQKEVHCSPFWGFLQFDDPTLQPDCNGMGPVVSPEFREYIGDVALHAGFSDRKLIGDLFVGVSIGDQP